MTADSQEPKSPDDVTDSDLSEEAEASTAAADESTGSPLDEIEKLREENQFLLDQVQRARAELANVRRRTADQRVEMQHRVAVDILREILPVFDDLTHALAAHQQGSGDAQLAKGLQMVVDKFNSVLEELNVERVPGVGESFDPSWHEAMIQCESAEHAPGTIVQEFEIGYRLGRELIRASRVSVAKDSEGS